MFIQLNDIILNVNEIKSIRINSTLDGRHSIIVATSDKDLVCYVYRDRRDAQEKLNDIYKELKEIKNG